VSSCPAVVEVAKREGLFAVSDLSHGEFILDIWERMCSGLGFVRTEAQESLDELRSIVRTWAGRPIGSRCEYPSYVSRDGFPAEFSVSWRDGRPELRVLFESLGEDLTAAGSQAAGAALTRELATRPGVSIDRYLLLEDLFLAAEPQPYRPTVWHSLAWRPGERPRFKVYLNPQAQGVARTWDVMASAMSRLGLARAWQRVEAERSELTARGHEIEFVALDLDAEPTARVKVYFRHPEIELTELNRVASLARLHDQDAALRAFKIICGRADGTVANQPMTCLAFRGGRDEPQEANVYLRLPGTVTSDVQAQERITELMQVEGVDPRSYADVLDGLSPGSLDTTVGLQELLSFRTAGRAHAELGVYFRFGVYDAAVDDEHA
jgi:DMATS type aromatic prenyltransferase